MELPTKPRVLVIDDHKMVAELLSQLLSVNREIDVHHLFDLASAMESMKDTGAYDLVLLDYSLPDTVGLSGFYSIKHKYPASRIVIMSGSIQKSVLTEAMAAGAAGFLPKSFPVKALNQTISLILSGVNFIPADMSHSIEPDTKEKSASAQNLNEIEVSVLKGLVGGLTNKTIGNQIGRTEVTVKMYVRKICKKLNAVNRTQAAMLARDMVFE